MTFICSPMPSHRISSGISASVGIARLIWTGPSISASPTRLRPETQRQDGADDDAEAEAERPRGPRRSAGRPAAGRLDQVAGGLTTTVHGAESVRGSSRPVGGARHHSRQQQRSGRWPGANGIAPARAEPAPYDALVDDRERPAAVGRAARATVVIRRHRPRPSAIDLLVAAVVEVGHVELVVVLLLRRAGPRSPGARAIDSSQLSRAPRADRSARRARRPSSGVRPSWST